MSPSPISMPVLYIRGSHLPHEVTPPCQSVLGQSITRQKSESLYKTLRLTWPESLATPLSLSLSSPLPVKLIKAISLGPLPTYVSALFCYSLFLCSQQCYPLSSQNAPCSMLLCKCALVMYLMITQNLPSIARSSVKCKLIFIEFYKILKANFLLIQTFSRDYLYLFPYCIKYMTVWIYVLY